MFVLYLDELGHDGVWDPNDSRHAHHPLFGLAGIAVPGDRCRDLDRGFFRLKCDFYKFEVEQHRAKGKRAERYEHKDLRNRRDVRFAYAVLDLIRKVDGTAFVFAVEKKVGQRQGDELYGRVAQGVLESFERYLRKKAGKRLGAGVIVMDRRNERGDVALLSWMQSHLYSADAVPRGFNRIVETPLLVRSEWYHGVQAADTVARVAGKVLRYEVTLEPDYKTIANALHDPLHSLELRDNNWSTIYLKTLHTGRWKFTVSDPSSQAPPITGPTPSMLPEDDDEPTLTG